MNVNSLTLALSRHGIDEFADSDGPTILATVLVHAIAHEPLGPYRVDVHLGQSTAERTVTVSREGFGTATAPIPGVARRSAHHASIVLLTALLEAVEAVHAMPRRESV